MKTKTMLRKAVAGVMSLTMAASAAIPALTANAKEYVGQSMYLSEPVHDAYFNFRDMNGYYEYDEETQQPSKKYVYSIYSFNGYSIDFGSERCAERAADWLWGCPMGAIVDITYVEVPDGIEILSCKLKGVDYVGDVFEDGIIDIYDLIRMRQYIGGITMLEKQELKNADINDDGKVDEEDLKLLNDYIHGTYEISGTNAEIGSYRLSDAVKVESAEGIEADDKFIDSQANFALETFKRTAAAQKENDETNSILVSPLSVMAALAMTANGADKNTLAEMQKVLGDIPIADLNEYLTNYIKQLTSSGVVKLADSIWYKSTDALDVKESFLEDVVKYYDAEVYASDFDSETVKDINNWVKNNTGGMIKKLLEKIDDQQLMFLINAVYFEAEWSNKYLDSYESTFYNYDGNEARADFMSDKENYYYKLDGAQAFRKNYKKGYSFVGILPDEKTDIYDYIANMDIDDIRNDLLETYSGNYELHVTLPKFKYDFTTDIRKTLFDMGMKDAFSSEKADFSRMGSSDLGNLFIDKIIHKTSIELDENGTKAAAVTAVMIAGCAAPMNIINLRFDRPFVYMLVDDSTNLPIFIGAVTNMK